jgi:hypothetical protein
MQRSCPKEKDSIIEGLQFFKGSNCWRTLIIAGIQILKGFNHWKASIIEGPGHSATPEKENESCSLKVIVMVTFRPLAKWSGHTWVLFHCRPMRLLVASNPVMGFAPSFQARDPMFPLRPVADRGTLIPREFGQKACLAACPSLLRSTSSSIWSRLFWVWSTTNQNSIK